MHVETQGNGRDVVLLHGNAPPASLAPLADALSERFRTHLVSLPGFRPSDEAYPEGMEQIRDLLVDYVRDLEGPVTLLGHSLGAYRAFAVALAAPEFVDSIVALSPVAGLEDEEREMFQQFAAGLRAGADLTDAALAQWVSEDYLQEHPEFRDEVAAWFDIDRMALAADIEASAAAPDLRGRLGEIECRTYVRTGELDVPIPPARARAISEVLPDSMVEIAPGVGHMLAFEDCEATVEAVIEFLE